jgi:hypothetical protein
MNQQLIDALATKLRSCSPGERAVLRRGADGTTQGAVAAYSHPSRIGLEILEIARPYFPKYGEEWAEKSWMFIASVLAEDPEMHQRSGRFGQALSRAKVSPTRVNTLLTADLHQNLGYLRATLRQVMSKSSSSTSVRFNWWEALALLTEEGEDHINLRKVIIKDFDRSNRMDDWAQTNP